MWEGASQEIYTISYPPFSPWKTCTACFPQKRREEAVLDRGTVLNCVPLLFSQTCQRPVRKPLANEGCSKCRWLLVHAVCLQLLQCRSCSSWHRWCPLTSCLGCGTKLGRTKWPRMTGAGTYSSGILVPAPIPYDQLGPQSPLCWMRAHRLCPIEFPFYLQHFVVPLRGSKARIRLTMIILQKTYAFQFVSPSVFPDSYQCIS